MMRRFLVGGAVLLSTVTLLIGMASSADAARCQSTDKKSECSGPCCTAGATTCEGHPCPPPDM